MANNGACRNIKSSSSGSWARILLLGGILLGDMVSDAAAASYDYEADCDTYANSADYIYEHFFFPLHLSGSVPVSTYQFVCLAAVI